LKATDKHALSHLIISLKWLHNKSIWQKEDATAAPFSLHKRADVTHTLVVSDRPERPPDRIADPCPQATLVKAET
jgi:hypothetical protein